MGWKNGQFMSNIERGLCSIPSKYLMKFCAILQIPVEEVIYAMVDDYQATLWKEASTQGNVILQVHDEIVIEERLNVTYPGMDASEAV